MSRGTPARVAGAVLSGVALTFAFAPYGWWPLAILAVASLTLLCRGVRLWPAILVGLGFGLGFMTVLLHWSGVFVGAAPWLLLSVFQALYFAPLGLALAAVQRLPWWPLWTAGLWVAQEAVRGRLPFGGFTWGRLAFSQDTAPTLGLAALAGAPLVSFAVALAGALLAWLVLRARAGQSVLAVVGVVGAAAVALCGLAVPSLAPDGRTVTVAMIQGNVPQLGLDFNAQREAVLRNHVDATLTLASDVRAGTARRPELVLWPENASDIDPYANPDARALIDQAVQAIGVPVLVGTLVETADQKNVENSGIVWDPRTGPGQRYVKRHPVPFAEYIPFRTVARMVSSAVDRQPRDFVKGQRVGLLQVGPAAVGDVICFEVAYDDLVRSTVRAGGQVIAVQTNNATFGYTPETEQQLSMSRLRAVEHARTVLVTSTSGVSAVVDPDGSVRTRADIFTAKTFVEQVHLSDRLTLATRLGGWPEAGLAVLGLAALAVALRPGRRRRSDTVAPAADFQPDTQPDTQPAARPMDQEGIAR